MGSEPSNSCRVVPNVYPESAGGKNLQGVEEAETDRLAAEDAADDEGAIE
jgi:hypothetical protein